MARGAPRDVETACPNCGHGPIAPEEERCPRCYMAFRRASGVVRHSDREVDPLGSDPADGTRIGGLDVLTSDAEAHPGTMAAALVALGLYAGAIALGAVPMPGPAAGYLVVAACDLLLGVGLLAVPAFTRPVVIISSPLQVATWLWLTRPLLPAAAPIAVALLPMLIFAGVTGATGPRRRSAVLAVVLGAVVFAATTQLAARSGPPLALVAPADGLRLTLPPGFQPVRSAEGLAPELPGADLDPRLRCFAFSDPVRGISGLWGIAAPGRVTAARLAEAVARQVDAGRGLAGFVHDDLRAMATLPQATWVVPLGGGRLASATALRLPDARTALLLISAPRERLEEARQGLAAAASFEGAADRR